MSNDAYRTSPAAKAAALAMYHETVGGQLAEPRAGVRIDRCSACLTRDHRDHYSTVLKRPLLMCSTCKTFTRHEAIANDHGIFAQLFACHVCSTGRTWGAEPRTTL